MPKVIAIILSGGKGTRLWPLSRQSYPKQFLPLIGDKKQSLLQETITRIIELEDVDISNLEFASAKKINSNTTKLIFIKNGIERVAVTKGDYEITDAIVVSGNGNNAKEIYSNTMYIPTEFKLKSAYPNPFNPITTLEMEIPQTGFVSVKVFNLVGQ